METPKKIICIALTLMFAIGITFMETRVATAEELKIDEGALIFVENVVGLDMTKYAVERSTRNERTPDNYGGMVREYVSYTLNFAEGETALIFTYVNGTMVRWALGSRGLSQHYVQGVIASNPLELTKDFLLRYQAHSKNTLIQQARGVLDSASDVKTQNITAGNLKLRITVQGNSTEFDWMYVINNLDFPTGLGIRVKDGILDTFVDETTFRRIGSADVNISQEEAINIAWERAKTITTLNISLGDTSKIVPFSLKQEPKTVQLQIHNREPFTSYPFWYIQFSAEEVQYGINGVEAGVWADTGELAYAHKIGYQGIIFEPEPENSVTPTGTPASTENPSPSMQSVKPQILLENDASLTMNTLLISLTASTIAIAVIATAVVLKRKRK